MASNNRDNQQRKQDLHSVMRLFLENSKLFDSHVRSYIKIPLLILLQGNTHC